MAVPAHQSCPSSTAVVEMAGSIPANKTAEASIFTGGRRQNSYCTRPGNNKTFFVLDSAEHEVENWKEIHCKMGKKVFLTKASFYQYMSNMAQNLN